MVDPDTFILRQSKCFSYEAPFLYLFFGAQRAILFDTGASPDKGGRILPIRDTVEAIAAERSGSGPRLGGLIVAHTHSHGDHVFWDGQFEGRPDTTVVNPGVANVAAFFGLERWPKGEAILDLGGRPLAILPLPGHYVDHIAIYDRRLEALLTGDTLYPGLLTVRDWPAYRSSAARLAAFAAAHPVSLVLGNHIEMSNRPGELYPLGTTFQPDEHPLPLSADDLREWHSACEAMGDAPRRDAHGRFVIEPL
jgi:glyoxylase-like metal-dependent hydrolase (beta-lactamase superfamily II)